ncbi:MAG: metal-dependent hydrolase [Flavobacteriales bacterium]|nr:metal-dependent hydrolase [Flavobacteriales bacterium]|tara:strand:+ start:5010 stop:5693 length:684 start_codon:yes stop_codon:yes gene_type:complete
MNITYYGHSCFLVDLKGVKILFDPFITPNPIVDGVDVNSIEADFILISHGHEDHVADVESIAKRTGAKLISNFEIISWFGAKGLEHGHPLNHGGKVELSKGITAKFVHAVHSSVLPDGTYGGNPGGWIIESLEQSFYYSGDTALSYDMKLLGDFYNLDFAFLCIGDNFTMGIEDSAIAANFVGVTDVIGMHYDSFGYIEIDHNAAKQHFKNKGLNLTLLTINESIIK